ncbi:MAG: type I-MYXAN CRISPR-associated protein Cas5/Cmx5/DevS [Cyanobacteria bacterium]|nr:type I-MYXAN CRISPR-associated protein Cas5/Cmx5/DevS [Cyanobacteriota bacterium]
MMESTSLYVSVPVASFRVPRAREYFETFPCPPPSTVYGMLLSLIGEVDRRVHEGAEIAIALLSEPAYSVVLRTVWRVKDRKDGPGLGTNRRPDFQELLSDLRLAIWVRQGKLENSPHCLAQRLSDALDNPDSIDRFGGLCLGESTHLVDDVSRYREKGDVGQVLMSKSDGILSLPIWPDHVGSKTRWGQYSLESMILAEALPMEAWTSILRPV